MESVWSVSKLLTESVGSRCELVANSCSHRRRDKTVSSRRRCVLGIRKLRLANVCVILSGVDGYNIGLNKPKFNYPYDVTLNRREHEGFGFVLVSSSSKSGATIGLC